MKNDLLSFMENYKKLNDSIDNIRSAIVEISQPFVKEYASYSVQLLKDGKRKIYYKIIVNRFCGKVDDNNYSDLGIAEMAELYAMMSYIGDIMSDYDISHTSENILGDKLYNIQLSMY